MSELTPSAKRFQDSLKKLGFEFHPVEFPRGTRTSEDAARAIHCTLGQIAKSIVFRCKDSEEPVLVIASGPNRVDEKKIERLVGEPVEKGNADFVREKTGFAIGGIPPTGHVQKSALSLTRICSGTKRYGALQGIRMLSLS